MFFSLAVISNFSIRLSCVIFVCYFHEYFCGNLVDIVISSVPSCVICYFRDNVRIMEGVLRMYSNRMVGVCYLLNFHYIWRQHL